MDYEQKYKEALELARDYYKVNVNLGEKDENSMLEDIFPELAESEDERIRKSIIKFLIDVNNGVYTKSELEIASWIDWLEKQGQSTFDKCRQEGDRIVENPDGTHFNISQLERVAKVEPKFKVGDCVVTSYGKVNQVVAVDEDGDGFTLDDDTYFSGSWKDGYHLWTIEDAKDGDVLYFNDDTIVIFKNLYNSSTFRSYCHIEDGVFNISKYHISDWWKGEGFQPANKEQRDILFQKMHEAGYEWDEEKKELKKIEKQESKSQGKELEDYYITPNKEFFQFIYDRLRYVHKENPNTDYMLSLKARISNMEYLEQSKSAIKASDWYVSKVDGKIDDMSYTLTYTQKNKDEQPKWSKEDEKNWCGIIDEIEANKSTAPDYDIETYDRFLSWLNSIKQRMGEQQ